MLLQSLLVNASRPRSPALCGNGRLRCVDDTQTKSPWRDPRCGVWTAMLSSWSLPWSPRILEPTSDNLCSTSRTRFVSISQIFLTKLNRKSWWTILHVPYENTNSRFLAGFFLEINSFNVNTLLCFYYRLKIFQARWTKWTSFVICQDFVTMPNSSKKLVSLISFNCSLSTAHVYPRSVSPWLVITRISLSEISSNLD